MTVMVVQIVSLRTVTGKREGIEMLFLEAVIGMEMEGQHVTMEEAMGTGLVLTIALAEEGALLPLTAIKCSQYVN